MFGIPGSGLGIVDSPVGPLSSYVVPSALASNLYSLEFSGGNGYANLVAPSGMNFDWDADSYTLSIWFKTTTLVSQQCLFARAKSGTAHIGVFAAINTDGTVYCYLGDVSTSGGDVSDFNWHQLTVTASGGTGKLYLDGVQVGSNISIGTETESGADWLIGNSRYNDNTDDGFPFYGWMQNFVAFNRALTPTEVADHYNSGTPTDPTTGTIADNLLRWWPLGQGDSGIPTVHEVGGQDGTLIHTAKVALVELSPVHTPSTLDLFSADTDASIDMRFDATSHPGTGSTGDWVDEVGSRHAVYDAGSGTVTVSNSTFGASHKMVTVNRLYRVGNNAEFAFTANCEGSLLYRMYTGDLDSSGGFYMGYDAHFDGYSSFQVYNLYYAEDVGFRIMDPGGTYNNWEVEQHTAIHPSKYVQLAVTWKVISGVARIRAYSDGGLLGEDTTETATFTPIASAPFGVCGNAYPGGGGYPSLANNQKFLAVQRYSRELTEAEIALKTARFNALKGYLR